MGPRQIGCIPGLAMSPQIKEHSYKTQCFITMFFDLWITDVDVATKEAVCPQKTCNSAQWHNRLWICVENAKTGTDPIQPKRQELCLHWLYCLSCLHWFVVFEVVKPSDK